jgi:predicted Zn-dependent peptidase
MNRSIAPKFNKAEKIDLIIPKKVELANGVILYWLNETQDETVKLDICWDAGSKKQNKALTASFTNALLLAGTKSKSAHQISEDVDYQGGYISHDIDKDQAGITLYGLKDKIDEIFNIFSDAFDNTIFPQSEIDKLIEIRKNGFNVSMEKVSTLCRQAFNQHIFGEGNQYGKVANIDDFDNVTQSDIIEFYTTNYINAKPTLFLVGRANESFIELLKNWSKQFKAVQNEFHNQLFNQTKGRIKIQKKDAIQTAIRVGHLMIQKNHPDYYKFQVLNTILGGYFGSRLMANIREDKGYTYGIGSGLSVLDDAAYFFISTEVANEVVDDTLTQIYIEIDKLKSELVTDDELEKVRNYLLGEFLRQSDGSIAMMENFKNIFFNNLTEDYYTNFIHAVNEVKPSELKDLANKYWNKENMLEVLAG